MTQTHDQLYSELFLDIQLNQIFPDSKTFVDSTPKYKPEVILKAYRSEKDQAGFELLSFVKKYFELPKTPTTNFQADTNRPVQDHINLLWDVLKREADQDIPGSSLIPLPHPYIVPGGRFGEIYYWDSYFTMLGLQTAGRVDMIEHMVDNFSYLIDTLGFIPNGNRSYFLGRSQPPFYSLMVKLLAEEKGEGILVKYLAQLEKEYAFWQAGTTTALESKSPSQRVVFLDFENKTFLNRYWDERPLPREESFKEDYELGNELTESKKLYRDLRAGCESGWDFSCRWFRDGASLKTIRTTELLPPDLNALLYHLEKTIAEAYQQKGISEKEIYYRTAAQNRMTSLNQYCWDEQKGIYLDYDFIKKERSNIGSLATMFPLFFKMASETQAARVANYIEKELLRPGGVVTTTKHSGQQWDAPNGWPPLQWISIAGLRIYGFDQLAETIKKRWIALNQKVYQNTGKMMEKYNVEDLSLEAGGGEYPVQDGFGWSNGVLLRLLSE